jgi:hypothetical protein
MFRMINSTNPFYYLRNWKDIALAHPLNQINWMHNAKHITKLALPFISLYAPVSKPLSYSICSWNLCHHGINLVLGEKTRTRNVLGCAKNIHELVTTFYDIKLGLFVHSAFDLCEKLYKFYRTPSKRTMEKILELAANLSYLCTFSRTYTLQWKLVSLVSQAILNLYQAYLLTTDVQKEGWHQKKSLDLIAKIAMSLIRVAQTHNCYRYIQRIEKFIQMLADLNSSEAEGDGDKNGLEVNKCASISDDDFTNLFHKIEAHNVVLKDTNGNAYNFGAFFNGYGRGLVNGHNLGFKKITLEDGSIVTELTFKISHVHRSRFDRLFEGLIDLSDEDRMDLAKDLGPQHNFEMLYNVKYPRGTKEFKKGAIIFDFDKIGSLAIGTERYRSLHQQVQVTLKNGSNIESFRNLLSIFGLDQALEKSNDEDRERLKAGLLFKMLFPSKSYILERDEEYFDLPVDQLKQTMIQQEPKMQDSFKEYIFNTVEVLPGLKHYSIFVENEAYRLGARALTATVTGISKQLDPSELSRLSSIMKNGMLSQELRELNQMKTKGLNGKSDYRHGGTGSIFTQVITENDLKETKSVNYVEEYKSPVRLYFSLSPLNRVSYQFFEDRYGERITHTYFYRPDIFTFLSADKILRLNEEHEIMIPHRIFPQEIKAMSVKSPLQRDKIADHFRSCNLIQMNEQGKETINGIPLDEFLVVTTEITPDLVKNCSPQSVLI